MYSEEITYSVEVETLNNETFAARRYLGSTACEFCTDVISGNHVFFEGYETYRCMCTDCARKAGIPDDIINVLERIAKEDRKQ